MGCGGDVRKVVSGTVKLLVILLSYSLLIKIVVKFRCVIYIPVGLVAIIFTT
jgi:hypothetical protein